MPASEPAFGHPGPVPDPGNPAGYSAAPGDHQNRVAQANHAAAHQAEAAQHIPPKSKNQRVDEANLAKLVAEENASRSKFPRYPGLERWELVEKMGDGAFSNVYRARDLQGQHGEVGIKVVRKYEMNSMQVSTIRVVLVNAALSFVTNSLSLYTTCLCHRPPNARVNTLHSPSSYCNDQHHFLPVSMFHFTNQWGASALFVGKQAPSSGF